MVRYNFLVKRPQMSAWLCMSRRFKFILLVLTFGLSIGLIVHVAENLLERHSNLTSIYNVQASIGRAVDLEWKYLAKVNKPDGWKKTAVDRGHIFSAYLDTRPEEILEEDRAITKNETTWAMVRIIAILDIRMRNANLTCVYKFFDGNSYFLRSIKATRVKPVAVREDFGLRYCAFFVLCELKISNDLKHEDFHTKRHLPDEVTIAPINIKNLNLLKKDYFIPVHYPDNINITTSESPNRFMGVCVQMFHHNYDKVTSLIEFIEFYQIMGAEHFTFYNRSMSSRVSDVLNYYQDKGIATVLPWELPPYFIFEKNLRVDGIFAALNECLYRTSFYKSFTYVAAVDVDELIVPRKHDNYSSMMQYLDPPRSDGTQNIQASFVFRNRFFYTMLEDDPITLPPEIPKLSTQSKTLRWTKANAAGSRSKFIVRGRQTVELGNHHTWAMRRTSSAFGGRYKEGAVDLNVGASHHYRTCETYADECWQKSFVRDRIAHRFTKELGTRVATVCERIFKNGCPVGKRYEIP